MLYHGSVRRFHSKVCYFIFTYTLLAFLVVFSFKKICLFDEVSNFQNRILTNQKPEYEIRNYQWNCMSALSVRTQQHGNCTKPLGKDKFCIKNDIFQLSHGIKNHSSKKAALMIYTQPLFLKVVRAFLQNIL